MHRFTESTPARMSNGLLPTSFPAFAVAALLAATLGAQPVPVRASSWPPLQLEMRVPFEPTAFPSAGQVHLAYEIHLRNFAPTALTLDRLEILEEGPVPHLIYSSEGDHLSGLLQPVGATAKPISDRRQVPAGGTAVVFVWLQLDAAVRVPDRLRHRVATNGMIAEGAVIGTHHSKIHAIGAPLNGGNWIASSGPGNESYHRRGVLVLDGEAVIDRRYAIDWRMIRDGSAFTGDENEASSYHAYGKEVRAVASGTVTSAKDNIPDNTPRHQGFRPAVPITLETLAGNTITLDLGGGQYAYYMHLQPGSITVKVGDRVQKGQLVARVGNSGDSREPHLHFEVTTSPKLLAGEGVPYLIDQFFAKSPDDSAQKRVHELPLNDMLIEFR